MYSLPPKVRLFDDISSENSKWGIMPSKSVCSFGGSSGISSKHVRTKSFHRCGREWRVHVFYKIVSCLILYPDHNVYIQLHLT